MWLFEPHSYNKENARVLIHESKYHGVSSVFRFIFNIFHDEPCVATEPFLGILCMPCLHHILTYWHVFYLYVWERFVSNMYGSELSNNRLYSSVFYH